MKGAIIKVIRQRFNCQDRHDCYALRITSIRKINAQDRQYATLTSIKDEAHLLSVCRITNSNRSKLYKSNVAMDLILARRIRRLFNGFRDSDVYTLVIITRECMFTFTFGIRYRAALVTSGLGLTITSNNREINCSKRANSANDASTLCVSIVRYRFMNFMIVLIIRVISGLRDISVRFNRPARRLLVLLRRFVMIRMFTNSELRTQDSLYSNGFITSAISNVGRTLNRVNANTRMLRLLTGLRQERTTYSSMIIAVICARRIVVLVLSNENISEGLNARFLPILKWLINPRRNGIKFKDEARIVRHIRVTRAILNRRNTTIRARATRQFNCPGEIAKRRIIMFQHTRRTCSAGFSGRLICRFLDLLLNRFTFTRILFGMSIGRDNNASSERNYAILIFCDNRMYRVGRLCNFANVLNKANRIRAVTRARLFGVLRNTGLFNRFFTITSSFIIRLLGIRAFLRRFLIFGRANNTVRHCATMITSSATATMNIKRANSSN